MEGEDTWCVSGNISRLGARIWRDRPLRFITDYDTLVSMGQELKSSMSSEVLGNLLDPVMEENGARMICQYGDMSCRVG